MRNKYKAVLSPYLGEPLILDEAGVWIVDEGPFNSVDDAEKRADEMNKKDNDNE